MKALIILTVLSVATGFARLPLVRLRAVNFCEPLASQQRCPVVRAANNDDDEEDEDDEWARRDAWEASLRRPTGSRKPTEPSRQPRPEPEPEPDDDDADDDDEGRQISSEEVAAFRAALMRGEMGGASLGLGAPPGTRPVDSKERARVIDTAEATSLGGTVLLGSPDLFLPGTGGDGGEARPPPTSELLARVGMGEIDAEQLAAVDADRRADLLPVLLVIEHSAGAGTARGVLLNRRTGYLLGDLGDAHNVSGFRVQPLHFGGPAELAEDAPRVLEAVAGGVTMVHATDSIEGAVPLGGEGRGLFLGGRFESAQGFAVERPLPIKCAAPHGVASKRSRDASCRPCRAQVLCAVRRVERWRARGGDRARRVDGRAVLARSRAQGPRTRRCQAPQTHLDGHHGADRRGERRAGTPALRRRRRRQRQRVMTGSDLLPRAHRMARAQRAFARPSQALLGARPRAIKGCLRTKDPRGPGPLRVAGMRATPCGRARPGPARGLYHELLQRAQCGSYHDVRCRPGPHGSGRFVSPAPCAIDTQRVMWMQHATAV